MEALAGRILGQRMDRSKPLWDIHIAEGLRDRRGALIVRIHHALADGIAGEALMNIMLDPTPEGSRAIRKRRSPRATSVPESPRGSFADGVASGIVSTLENLISAESRLCDVAMDFVTGRMRNGLLGLASVLPELAMSIERLPFNKPCGSERKFCWAEFDFNDVQAIRTAEGGTVNDVILTALMLALGRYVEMHGESTSKRYVRVVCPINLRRDDKGESLGNRIAFMPVALPIGIKDPVRALHEVAKRTAIMKGARAADLVALMASWLGVSPPPLQALIWSVVPDIPLPAPLLNMICTNVAGPPVPLYSVGRKLIASYPHVPTGYELGVNCAAQTYNGKLFYGFTADAQAAPDVGRLRDFLTLSFEELCRAAGVRKVVRRAARAAAKPATPRARPKKATAKQAAAERRAEAEAASEPEPQRPAAGAANVMTARAGST